LAVVLVALAFAALAGDKAAAQQPPPGLLAPGNAVVTGFSGASPPVQIAPGIDPARKTFIDPNGLSLRIIDLQHMGGPPTGRLVSAPKSFSVSAAQIGQVFGVALDANTPPNIYAAASSAYGLPIVAPGPDRQPVHLQIGAPNATFMPGLWGRAAPNGGPGSIWKIDGRTGAVSLFVNVTLDGQRNSGPALGGLAFDPITNSLLVADRETGFIHRYDLRGSETGRYRHGVEGRQAEGMTPVVLKGGRRLDITSPQFDSRRPDTWNYASPERLVFGLAVHQRRLYYAVAGGLQIWSVGLGPDGSFLHDATIEVVVPPAAGPTEISKITFDEQGRMILAERPAPTGAEDFEALTTPGIGRVLRYAMADPEADTVRVWQKLPDDYAIGFPLAQRNGNGGAEIGYSYDFRGMLDRASCGGFLWSSGEELRVSADRALAAQIDREGPADVDGLQGNATWRVRRFDELPRQSYFIDYDDRFEDKAARGHMGDIAIWRPCSPAVPKVFSPPSISAPGRPASGGNPPSSNPPGGSNPPGNNPPGKNPPGNNPPRTNNPPGSCPSGQFRDARSGSCQPGCSRPNVRVGGTCCAPDDLRPGGACGSPSCGSGMIAVGPSNFCCNAGQVYAGPGGAQACCLNGHVSNGQCMGGTPPVPPGCSPGSNNSKCCASGYVPTGSSCCAASQATSTGVCCPSGQSPGGTNNSQCQPGKIKYPPPLPPPPQRTCCAGGLVPATNGSCCAASQLTTTGICCPAGAAPDPNDHTHCSAQIQVIRAQCAAGSTRLPNGTCCPAGSVSADGRSCLAAPPPDCTASGPDFIRNPRNAAACIRCRDGLTPNADRTACVRPGTPPVCGPGEVLRDGRCMIPPPSCGAGEILRDGHCVPPLPVCGPGEVLRDRRCTTPSSSCAPGELRLANGECVRGPPETGPNKGEPRGEPPPRVHKPPAGGSKTTPTHGEPHREPLPRGHKPSGQR
jgi:hypothetical protein